MMAKMHTAIIGGGIAGLAAAYELEKARGAGAAVSYTLFEALPRLGGSLSSEIIDGCVVEHGPDSFLTEKPAAAELCRELGGVVLESASERLGPQRRREAQHPSHPASLRLCRNR